MSKSSPLSREGLSPSLPLSLIDQNPQVPPPKKKRKSSNKPPSELQRLSTELNWELAQITQASHHLQHICHKYNVIIPKLFLKDVPAAQVIQGFEKELRERVQESRLKRTRQIREKAALDIGPLPE